METTKKRARIVISGKVMGVYYRAFAETAARAYGITGFVRNTPQEEVEIVAEGPIDKMARFIKDIKKGPETAKVEHVDVKWETATGEFDGFEVRYWDSHV